MCRRTEGDDQYALAADHYRNGRWSLAVTEFQTLLQKQPDHARVPLAHFFMGETRIQTQEYDQCVQHFTYFVDHVAQHPLRTRALFRRAEAYYLIGEDDTAVVQLESLLKDKNAQSYFEFALVYLGEMYQRRGTTESRRKAKQHFERALATYPSSAMSNRCRLGLAQIFQADGQLENADRFLQFLVDAEDPTIQEEAIVSRASILVELQRPAEAKALLSPETLQQLPAELQAKAIYWLGKAELVEGEWEAAAADLRRAVGALRDDNLAEAAVYDCAIALWRMGDQEGADELLQQSTERWPAGRWAAEARFLRIQAALETGDAPAVPHLVSQFANHHQNHPLWNRVLEAEGRAAFARGDYRQAIKSFSQLVDRVDTALEEDQQWLPSWTYMLAISQLADHKYRDGLESIQRCETFLKADAQESDDQLLQSCHLARCTALMKLQRFEEAVPALAIWLKQYAGTPLEQDMRFDYFWCLFELKNWGDLEKQFAWAKTTVDAATTEKEYQPRVEQLAKQCLHIGRHYYESDEDSLASKWFQLASRSDDPEVQKQATSGLAWTEFRSSTGQKKDAAFAVLMERFPDNDMTANAALHQAEQLVKDGKLREAKNLLRDLVRRDASWDNRHLALAMLARLTVNENSNASRRSAIRYLEQAIADCRDRDQLDQPMDAYHYELAWLQAELNQATASQTSFREIHLKYPHSRYWADATFRVAQGYFDLGNNKLAGEMLQALLERKAKEPALVTDSLVAHVTYLQTMLAVRETDWPLVEERAGFLVSHFPDHTLRWNGEYWRAEAMYRRGDYPAAIAAMRLIVDRTTGTLDPWIAMAHLRLAQSLGQRGQWAEANAAAQRAKELFPEFRQDYELDYLIGRAQMADARFEDARSSFEKVIESEQGKSTETAAMAQWMIGESYFHQEQYETAARAYHKTELLYAYPQWQAASLLQAGKCYEHLSQETMAISTYRQLVRDYAGHALADQGQKRMQRLIDKQNLTATGQRNPVR